MGWNGADGSNEHAKIKRDPYDEDPEVFLIPVRKLVCFDQGVADPIPAAGAARKIGYCRCSFEEASGEGT